MPAAGRPQLVERYAAYTPPFDVKALIQKMVASVPPKYLVGLAEIILTDTADLPRTFRRGVVNSRKKRFRMIQARGVYHPNWNNHPAWIEIFVDNTLRAWERGLWLKFRLYREPLIGDVLFHEIGHHIHFAVRPEYREREDVADVWKTRLSSNYTRKAYPLFGAIARTLQFLTGRLIAKLVQKSAKMELKKGLISRAEFDERMKSSRKL